MRTLMLLPGVHIETLLNPALYTATQIERACRVAYALGRGRFVLVEPPLSVESES